MALLVADSRSEKFEKAPPPKKKWIQDYLEDHQNFDENSKEAKDVSDKHDDSSSSNDETAAAKQEKSAGTIMVNSVIHQFQDFIHLQNNRNQIGGIAPNQNSDKVNAGKIAQLLDPKRGGDKFNVSLQKISTKSDSINISQKELGGVVQGVISQFLNGSLSDSYLSSRSSRKRCRRHDKCPSRSHRSKDRGQHSHDYEPPAKLAHIRTAHESSPQTETSTAPLNLSLPKAREPFVEHARVKFAAEDSCYSTDSQRSMEISKSQRMHNDDEALDLGIRHKPLDGQLHNAYQPFHMQSNSGSHHNKDGYIKPVPLSILIKSPASLSPEVSPPTSPVAPVNLSTKCIAASSDNDELPKQVIQRASPLHQYSSSSVTVTPLTDKPLPPVPNPPVHRFSKAATKQYSDHPKIQPTSNDLTKTSVDVATKDQPTSKVIRKKSNSSSEKNSSAGRSSPNNSKQTNSTNREIHNQLEKNRRAQLKLCFEELANECQIDPKTKASNQTVIVTAKKVVMNLRQDEKVNERELANLVQEKIKLTQKLEELRRYMDIKLNPTDD